MDFFTTASGYVISALFFLLIVGAVLRAWILFPRQIHDLEKRVKQLEKKESK